MKKFIYIFFISIVLSGCTTSILLVKSRIDKKAYSMFGKTPQKTFFVPINISDSLKLKWESDTRGALTNSSVTVSDSIVFVNDLYGRVYAFNFYNGKKIGEIKNKGAVYTTPVISNLRVVFVVSMEEDDMSKFIIYDFTIAKSFREVDIEGRVETEILKTPDGFIVTTLDGDVIKYNDFGIFQWKTKTEYAIRCNSTFLNDNIYFGNDNGEIISLNNSDGEVNYRKKIDGMFRSGNIIENSKLFITNVNGSLYCLNPKSGDVIWKFQSNVAIMMTPVMDNSNIYVGNLSGSFYSVDKNTGKKKWEINTDGLFNITPLVTNNVLIVPDFNKKILLIDKVNGTIKKSLELKGRAKLSPVIYKNTLFIGYDRGNLQAYEIN